MSRLSILFYSFLFLSSGISGQQLAPKFRNYTNTDGLPSSEVYQIVSDNKGYLWFATDAGVARFDGLDFRTFTVQDSLPENSVLKLFKDYKGRIWFNSLSGKFSYFENGKIIPYRYNYVIEKKLKNPLYGNFCVDEHDGLHFSIYAYGGFSYSLDNTGELKQGIVPNNYNNYEVTQIGTSGLYAAYNGLSDKQKTFIKVLTESVSKSVRIDERIDYPHLCASLMTNGDVLFGCNRSLLRIRRDGSYAYKKYSSQILSIYADRNNKIWIGFYQTGLYQLDSSCNIIHKFFEDLSVTSITQDIAGGFWFSTLENGVYYTPNLNVLKLDIKEDDKSNNKVNCIYALPDSTILFGTSRSVVYRYRPKEKKIETLNLKEKVNDDVDAVISIGYLPKNNQIFLGCVASNTGLERIKKIRTNDLNIYVCQMLGNIAFRDTGNIYTVNFDRVFEIDTIDLSYHTYGADTFRVSAIAIDGKNQLLVGSISGLYYFENGRVKPYSSSNPIFKNRITDIKTEGNRMVLATKEKGIVVVNEDSVFVVNTQSNLSSDNVRRILVEGNTIWAATNRGINRITIHQYKPFRYSIGQVTIWDGLVSDEVNDICKIGDRLYAATSKGVNVVDVTKISDENNSQTVDISNISFNGLNVTGINNLQVGPEKFAIHLYYTGINYSNQDSLIFRRRSIGISDEWVETRNREAIFTQLSPGKYRFEVQARTEYGTWSPTPAYFDFTVLPAFYQTLAFRIFIALLLVSLAVLIFLWRIRSIKMREEKKTELNKRIAEAELKALRSQMNPHFTFNVLNSIQYYITKKDTDSAQRYLTRFSRLVRIILEQSKDVYITLEQEINMLRLYLELEEMRFENKFRYHVDIDSTLFPSQINMPGMLIQPLVENAIKHGIEHKKGEAFIELSFNGKDSTLICMVRDNGVGREMAERIKINDNNYKSVATSLLKERIEALQQLYNISLNYRVEDLFDVQGNPAGTEVSIEVPIANNN